MGRRTRATWPRGGAASSSADTQDAGYSSVEVRAEQHVMQLQQKRHNARMAGKLPARAKYLLSSCSASSRMSGARCSNRLWWRMWVRNSLQHRGLSRTRSAGRAAIYGRCSGVADGKLRSQRAIAHRREPLLKVKRSATGSLKRRAILSRVSNDGAFLPRSIRLRKSTDKSSVSANCSCVIRRCARISRRCLPNFCLSVATWRVFPSGSLP